MKRVLVVDDSPLVCQLLRIELEPFDIEVVAVDTIEKGVAAVQEDGAIEAVMLDLSVTEMQGGRTVLERFARDGAAVPVIIQSAVSESELVEKREAMGAAGYFRKGSDLLQLVRDLERVTAKA